MNIVDGMRLSKNIFKFFFRRLQRDESKKN